LFDLKAVNEEHLVNENMHLIFGSVEYGIQGHAIRSNIPDKNC